MSTFLAIDFGTSNCSAAVINVDKKLEFVPLDGDSFFLPSSIFVQVSQSARGTIDEARLKVTAERLFSEDKKRYQDDLEVAKKRYRDFYNIYVPIAKDPNQPYKKNSLRKYVSRENLESAIENFKTNELAAEKSRILADIKPVDSLAKFESNIRTNLELSSIKADIGLLSEESFFTAILDSNSKIFFGNEALNKYSENPLSGFFMRSPKAFLGTSLNSRSIELFIKIIALIIEQIKIRSESYFKTNFDSVVFGRPVNYLANDSDSANKQAISIMNAAALRVGFTDIRYVIEPFAAALVSRRTMFATKSPSLLLDIGGGTTDVAVIAPIDTEGGSLNIIASSGSRVGGDDFDQIIAFKYFINILKQNIDELHTVTIDALSTRDLHAQSRFAKTGQNIINVLNKNKISHNDSYLYDLYRGQLQHKVILFAEKIKFDLGKSPNFDLLFNFLNFSLRLNHDDVDFNSICSQHLNQINNLINLACNEADLEMKSAMKVFITGGMSNCDALLTSVKDFFPQGSVFYRLSPLNTIITGLAVVANHLTTYEINRPISSVFGVPVDRYI